jgi:hypothetical protein
MSFEKVGKKYLLSETGFLSSSSYAGVPRMSQVQVTEKAIEYLNVRGDYNVTLFK